MKKIVVLFLAAFLSMPSAAHALCSSPPGAAGDQIYNSSHNVMQYCNGNQWIAMGSGGGGGGGADTLGNLACNNGESIEFDGTNWNCVGGKVSRTGDTMTGTLTLSPPTAGTHAATKSYVDAAVAGASGGGGTGTTCMYFAHSDNPNCPTGWAQAGGANSYRPDASTWHRVCCMGGGSLLDEMPATFDFPASPSIAYNAGHTWTPLEITGFDSASVSIITTAASGVGEFRICADSSCSNVLKGWGTQATGIASGNYLQIRIGAHTNLRSDGAKIAITVGGMTDIAEITSSVGSPYFLAFVSSQGWRGDMILGVAAADAKCQAAATAANLVGTFRAWIADATGASSPSARFENSATPAKFVLPNGTAAGWKIADNWSDLVDGNIDAVFNRNENGALASNVNVWTNVNFNGSQASSGNNSHCSGWTTGGSRGTVGNTSATNSQWSYAGTNYVCADDVYRLYCFQTVLPN